MTEVLCDGQPSREVNRRIKELLAAGEREITVRGPAGRHNLAVAVLQPATITFDGSVGYYCGGMIDGAEIDIHGSAGWGLAESMQNGTVVCRGNAGNAAAASIRGGTVVVHGDAAARAGVSMKGGLLLIGGSSGYMTGFMAQKGTIIVCGDAAEGFGDSMYACTCYVGGSIAELGSDAILEPMNAEDVALVATALDEHLPPERRPKTPAKAFKKIVAGRKLWNFDHRDWETWRAAL